MFNLRLGSDWRKVLRHAWSVRFIGLAAVLMGIEVALPLIQPYVSISPYWIAAAAGLAACAGFVARFIAQKEFDAAEQQNGG